MTVSARNLHQERMLQDHMVAQLVAGEGYEPRDPTTDYDRALAMDRALTLRFVQESQPDAWDRLYRQQKGNAGEYFLKQLERNLNLRERGPLDVLRNGITIVPNIRFQLCFPRPASALVPERIREYESNILSVMKEVEYSTRCGNRIDVVLFLNGLPVVTMEVKNIPTGTTFRHAERQYRTDRSPAGEPLLTFRRGALVHFALDEDNVSMTTRLMNGRTRFLPFNRGRDGGAGNADIPDEHRIAYLYRAGPWGEAVLSRPVLLDVIWRFMHLEGRGRKAAMIFPRYHQLDAVRRIMAHAGKHGTGSNYLVQHSAGSGKSNTIAWLAHHAVNLHDAGDRAVFDTAVIVTDRVVLDRQLQETVSQFERTAGVVRRIDGTSRQLKEAIAGGARIIVTTIQKFSTDHLAELSGQGHRNFAVIVDEAHSSQSGRSAQAMTDALTREAGSSDDIEDLIAAYQKARGPQANISFLAFTATPRNVTLERFGMTGEDGLPEPFHLYSMRQAIGEGFILDVLRNYMTYEAYYQLEKTIADDPELYRRRGQKAVARFASLHPTAIGQKVGIIVEHFRRHVLHELDGQAKAMVVTQSREHALRYFLAVREYLRNHGYDDMNALVAFSGDLRLDGETFTETSLNGFAETELPGRFDGLRVDGTPYPDTYHILIVAEKYQTGFDQPRLCAMYVDRRLSGLQAVQTLSRLNRTCPGKERTFILDFQNTIEDIQEAFRPYYEATAIDAMSDPNQIYDLERRLFASGYLDRDDIERFARTFFGGALRAADRPRLEGLVREAVNRFQADDDEGRQEGFRQLLGSYGRFYAFIAQVVSLEDTELEKLACYGGWLSRLLPNRGIPPDIEVTEDMLSLQAFRVDRKEEGSASLSAGDTEGLDPISAFGAKPYTEDERKDLSELVKAFNERHGTRFTEGDMIRFEQVNRDILDGELSEMLRRNPPDVVYSAFADAFLQGAIRLFQRDSEMRNIVLSDQEAREKATCHFFNRALRQAREAA